MILLGIGMLPAWLRLEPSGRSQTRFCEVPNCGKATREGKTYCSDHVELHPYVKTVIARVEVRDAEDEQVSKCGAAAVNLKGLTAQELYQLLWLQGPRTEQRLARELNIDLVIVRGYVSAMVTGGIVLTDYTRRGSIVVKLVNPPSPPKFEDEADDDD